MVLTVILPVSSVTSIAMMRRIASVIAVRRRIAMGRRRSREEAGRWLEISPCKILMFGEW